MKTGSLFVLSILAAITLGAPAYASGGNGMSWSKLSHNSTYGVDEVGCANCNAYTGDALCYAALPILCIKQDGSPTPSGLYTDFYNGWASGNIATTPPIQGTTLTSLTVANQICASYFGTGWRMAEFHDGSGGWNWYAYGNIRDDLRLWVAISDTPANCWN